MEEYNNSKSPRSNSNTILAESLWKFINNPVVTILSDLENIADEQMLCSLLESIHKGSTSFKNILIPPDTQNDELQQQYTAFTTWLFGALFYLLSTPLSDKVFTRSIEIQACMLRVLAVHHAAVFDKIHIEYLEAYKDILNLYDTTENDKEIALMKFNTDRYAIENLDLMSYPAKIQSNNASSVQSSILKIIIKSNTTSWNQKQLWPMILETLIKSPPEVKLVALELCAEIMKFDIIDDEYNETLYGMFNCCIEIAKTIPIWINNNHISKDTLARYTHIFKEILQPVTASLIVCEFCFQTLGVIAFVFIPNKVDATTVRLLENVACSKIKKYLDMEPRPCTISEARKLISYFKHSTASIAVLIEFIFIEIKRVVVHKEKISAKEVCEPWRLLREELINLVQREQYDQSLCVLKATCLLESWIMEREFQVTLYESDVDVILQFILQHLNSNRIRPVDLMFENLIYLLAHNETKKDTIQPILFATFKTDNSFHDSRIVHAVPQNNLTKIKCIEGICQFGYGKERVQVLNSCVLGTNINLIVTAVQNCILLLKDEEIDLEDISRHILKPALGSENEVIHEALAKVLCQIICLLSGSGKILNGTMEDLRWTIKCECCSNNVSADMNSETYFLSKQHDLILRPYIDLLSSDFAMVRLRMSESFLSFSNHLESFNSNEITKRWLPYIQDTNEEVRNNVITVVGRVLNNRLIQLKKEGILLLDDVPADLDQFVDLVIDTMVDTLGQAINNSDQSLHITLLMTAKELICVPLYLTELRVLNIFLVTIMNPNSSPTAVAAASTAYQDIVAALNVTPKALYTRYKKDFIKVIMKRSVYNYVNHSYNIATSVHKIAKCFGYQGSRQLLRKDGHYAVCYLLPLIIEIPKAVVLLNDMAELVSTEMKQMLVEYFPYICCHAFLNMSPCSGPECLRLTSELTKMSLPALAKLHFTTIFGEMMLNFHESPNKIFCILELLSEYDNSGKQSFSTFKSVASYLKPRLHGILVNLDINISSKSDEYTQQTALASLAALIQYMGAEYITPLRYKILGTLRTYLSLERPGFGPLVCNAWDAFIRNVAIKDLGPLLPTIFVSLIPLLEKYPKKINVMLEFLLIENKSQISDYMLELFFIDDIKLSENLKNIIKAHILQLRPTSFGENLKLWLKRITHETDEVRMKALIHLQTFLNKHRDELNDMILNDVEVHPLIVELLDTLLIGCQEKDHRIRILYGECLGELGAIEPSLLPRKIISRDDSKFISDANEEFGSALLFELVRAFQTQKSTQSMDCFSLAIQEILKAYEISPQGKNNGLWNSLPVTTRQMIHPFLTSHYKITVANDKPNFPHPIYGSEACSSVETWAYNWLCSLSSSIKNETICKTLHACKPAFKRDIKTVVFCLPYVASYIIANESEDMHDKLREEMLTVISIQEGSTLDPELLRHRPLRYDRGLQRENARVSDEAIRMRCSQIIFSILDHLQRWLRERRLNRDNKYKAMQRFFGKLDNLMLSKGCYQSHEYHRALMYLEQHMVSTNKGLSEEIEGGLLAKIYAQLDEPDGVSGILATQDHSPTLQQLVLAHEVNGQLQDAATCYERLAQKKALKSSYLQGMIQCYLGLDQPFTAINITKGVLSSRPELEPLMIENETFWRLAHFTRLDDTIHRNIKHGLLEDLKSGIKPDLFSLKQNLVSLLEDAARPGAYQQCYPCIMKLHIINEFEKAATMMLTDPEHLPKIFYEWEKRGQLVRASRGIEFVLNMRRATLDLALQLRGNLQSSELKQEIGKIWLKSAKIARKAGLHQRAYMYILSATDSCPPQELHIEQAQLYWKKGCQEEAFTTLRRCFSNHFQPAVYYKQLPSNQLTQERKQCAKAKLLYAKYNDKTLNVDTDGNILNYKEAIEVWREWERSLLACAQYYESVVNRMTSAERDTKGRDLQIHMLNYYGKSLQYGCKYIHQSMPRMLTIWLDFASRATAFSMYNDPEKRRERQETLTKMTKIMEVYRDRLPTFTWLTAFSQLVSRICHPSTEVQKTLCTIIVKLISTYPQHCLWMMASVVNSSYAVRQKRCQEIFNHQSLKTPAMCKLIKDFNKLWEKLIGLSNKPIPDDTLQTTVSQLAPRFSRMLESNDFSSIMIPTTKNKQIHLPAKGVSRENYNPFSDRWVGLVGIEEKVVVMPSLQRPRRITLRGSDGKLYLFMCKPKDDLRRDFRLMEFNDIVNKYLQKDPESRQRRLYIRTYSVVPLNETCGLIEWVPNLVGFRPILLNLYKERSIAVTGKELKTMICELKDPLEKKRRMFIEKLVPRHPPVLGDWFRLTFPDPYGWYEARTAYIRTTAVMSMVGYILGLGDRHGENILFDSKCGDCVHVDFNCLFNKGELFNWPERVPFRLTHNMVDAMGPLKVEGPFRRACQVTMRVLREQSSTLISILTPFVYDPLVTWNKNQSIETGEKTNEKAVEHIKNIEQRLEGLIRSQGKKLENISLNLSVEGQINHLILEATNIDNLCQMYFGWGAYM